MRRLTKAQFERSIDLQFRLEPEFQLLADAAVSLGHTIDEANWALLQLAISAMLQRDANLDTEVAIARAKRAVMGEE